MNRPRGWGLALLIQTGVAVVSGLASVIIWAGSGGYFWPQWVLFGQGALLAVHLAGRAGRRAPTAWSRGFGVHLRLAIALGAIVVIVWLLAGAHGLFWPVWPLLALAITVSTHAIVLRLQPPDQEKELAERVDVLTRSRRGVVDVQAAELKRIERDLHDGTQARMVSLAMNLGLAEQLTKHNPDAAAELMAEARQSTLAALDELRTVMHGIQPPVLSDRGLAGAIEALALDLSVPTTVIATLPGRPATPVESAVYLAVTECLANVVKHAGAANAWVALRYNEGVLSATVGDDGVGGASLGGGTGLTGVARRLEVFDGTIDIRSPADGPTEVIMEIPCELL